MNKHLTIVKTTVDSYLDVQSILDSAQYYYMKVEGVPKMENTAKEVFESLPPNCTYEDKFVFFIELNGERIGIVDLVFRCPVEGVAFIGLLLLKENLHRQGLGVQSYQLVEDFIKMKKINTIQLGVNDINEVGMKFWTKLGFTPNGRTRLNQGLKVTSTVIVLEKNIN